MHIPSYLRHRGYTFGERVDRTKEALATKLARKVPKRIQYWVVVDAALLVEPKENPSNVTANQMLDAIGKDL